MTIDNIRYDDHAQKLYILDQTLLPNEEKEIELATAEDMYDAIKKLKVRGAPAIGICAAYCIYILSLQIKTQDSAAFCDELEKQAAYPQLLPARRPSTSAGRSDACATRPAALRTGTLITSAISSSSRPARSTAATSRCATASPSSV